MLFCVLKGDKGVGDGLVLESLRLRVEEVRGRVEGVKQVLGDWHELVGLLVDESQHLEDLQVVGEVLRVVCQPDGRDT